MATTPHIPVTHIDPLAAQKEVVANEGFDAIVKAAYEHASITLPTATETLDALDIWDAGVLVFTSAVAATTITFPVETNIAGESAVPIEKVWICVNDTAYALTLTAAGGTETIEIPVGESVIIRHDATDLWLVAPNTTGTSADRPYRLALYIRGKPVAGQTVWRQDFDRTVRIPAALAGSAGGAATASTGATPAFSLKKNGSEFGTITYNASATPTFAAASSTDLTTSDVFTIVAPGSQDATLADVDFLIKGTYV